MIDPKWVVARLEEAGATLLALPNARRYGLLSEAVTAAHHALYSPLRANVSAPSAQAITRMDEALAWISLIPKERYVLRRIVGARALTSPITGRPLYSWRRLGGLVGADHKAVQRWHADGIAILCAAVESRLQEAEAKAKRAA